MHLLQYLLDGIEGHERIFAGMPVLTDDVVITLCTDTMLDWARSFLHNGPLMMDSTFGTNKVGCSLFIVLTMSPFGSGLPVCYFIAKREPTDSIATGLRQFRDK